MRKIAAEELVALRAGAIHRLHKSHKEGKREKALCLPWRIEKREGTRPKGAKKREVAVPTRQ